MAKRKYPKTATRKVGTTGNPKGQWGPSSNYVDPTEEIRRKRAKRK